jgi:hypothetical protein
VINNAFLMDVMRIFKATPIILIVAIVGSPAVTG